MDAGRTRWRRFGAVMLLSTAATAGVVALVAHGAVAASFSISGQQFKVGASKLEAWDFVQYGAVDEYQPQGSKEGTKAFRPVAVSAMRKATLNSLCQSVYTPLGPLSVTLVIRAGEDPNHPVTATNMTVDMTQLDGDATFDNIQLGRDAAHLDTWDGADPDETRQRQNFQGAFGQQATHVVITGLQQKAWATSAGQFNLNGLHLSLKQGQVECFPG